MSYIPSHLAALKLDELRRQADLERRSREAGRAPKAARATPARRPLVGLPILSLGRATSHS